MSCGCCADAVPLWVTMGLLALRAKGVTAVANASRPDMVGMGGIVASGIPAPPEGWYQEIEVVASYRVYKWPEPSPGSPPPDGPVFQRMFQRTWRRTHEGDAVVFRGQVLFEDSYDESDPLSDGEFFGMEPDSDPEDYAGDLMEFASSRITATGAVSKGALMGWAEQKLDDADWGDYSLAVSESPAVGFGQGIASGMTYVPWNSDTPGEAQARAVEWRLVSSPVWSADLGMIEQPDGQYKLHGTVELWEAEMTEDGLEEDKPVRRRLEAPWSEEEGMFATRSWTDLGMPQEPRFSCIEGYAFGVDLGHVFHE